MTLLTWNGGSSLIAKLTKGYALAKFQSSGIKIGYGRTQGATGGRDGAVAQRGGCCN